MAYFVYMSAVFMKDREGMLNKYVQAVPDVAF